MICITYILPILRVFNKITLILMHNSHKLVYTLSILSLWMVKILKFIVLAKGYKISNPLEADRLFLVDLKENFIREEESLGASKGLVVLTKAILKAKSVKAEGIIVSSIGLKGLEISEKLNINIYRFKGELKDLLDSRYLEKVSGDNIDICDCCMRRL